MATMPDMEVLVKFSGENGATLPAGQYVSLSKWAEACPHGPTVGQMRDLIRHRNQNGINNMRVCKKIGKQWVFDLVQFSAWFKLRSG